MHSEAYAFVQSVAPQRKRGLVLEIGGRDINGSVRGLFNGDPYVAIDVAEGPGVDVVADGVAYVPPEPPATVVCCEVLEHTSRAADICRHAHDILAPGGTLILTAAGEGRAPHSAADGGPLKNGEYYLNIFRNDLKRWLNQFEKVQIDTNAQSKDIYAFAVKGDA